MLWALRCLTDHPVRPREAVMFDIDDTLITRNGKPMRDTIQLLEYCKMLGYKVVLMTARPSTPFTKGQLRELRIPYDYLMFVPAREKTRVKKQLKLKFIMSVGDKVTDLGGSSYWIKLPESGDPRMFTNISTCSRNSYTL